MRKAKNLNPYIVAAAAWLASAFAAVAQVEVDTVEAKGVQPEDMKLIEDTVILRATAPTNTWYGTRGLSQTPSAEGLGAGRLVMSLNIPWYQQDNNEPGAPNENADIFTGRVAAAYGITRYIDAFGTFSFYSSNNYTTTADESGFGTVGGGLQGNVPFSPSAPFRVGAQLALLNGVSDNQININGADGYNYFDTRTDLDFHAKLLQTIFMGAEDRGFKVHFNEGIVTSAEDGRDPLLVTAVAAQLNLPVAALGVELNSRTDLDDVDMADDPLWVTPSAQFRTGYNLNLNFGGNISLSGDREGDPTRALEPYSLFGGLAFTFDAMEEKRRNEKLKMWRQAQYMKAAQIRQDTMARSALEDTLLSSGLLVLDKVYFKIDSANISLNSQPYLDQIAKLLVKYPKLQIEVAGHADSTGTPEHNQVLSQQRAEAVAAYLTSIEPSLTGRIQARGYGETSPEATNETGEGRELNRRTELEVVNKDALKEYNGEATEEARAPETEGGAAEGGGTEGGGSPGTQGGGSGGGIPPGTE